MKHLLDPGPPKKKGSPVILPELTVTPDQPFARGLERAAAINRRVIPGQLDYLRKNLLPEYGRQARGLLAGVAQDLPGIPAIASDAGDMLLNYFSVPDAKMADAIETPATDKLRESVRGGLGLAPGEGLAGEVIGALAGTEAIVRGASKLGDFGKVLHDYYNNFISNPAGEAAGPGRRVGASEAARVTGGARGGAEPAPKFRSAAVRGVDKHGNEYIFEAPSHPQATYSAKQAGYKVDFDSDLNDGFVDVNGTYHTRRGTQEQLPRGQVAKSERMKLKGGQMPGDEQIEHARSLTQEAAKAKRLTSAAGGITPEQLAQRTEGFTFDPRSKTFVENGTGFVVANPPGQKKLLSEFMSQDAVAKVLRDNKDLLKQDGMYLGSWYNKDTGQWETEVSQIFPTQEEALKVARERGEKAIWDLGAGKEIQAERRGLSPSELVDRLPPELRTDQGLMGYTGPERRGPPQMTVASPSELVDRLPIEKQTHRGLMPSFAEEAAAAPDAKTLDLSAPSRSSGPVSEFTNAISPHRNPLNPRERVLGPVENPLGVVEFGPGFDGAIDLKFLRAFEPGKGHGSALLRQITDMADKMGVTLTGISKPVGKGGLPAKQLREFYKRNGFVFERGDEMIRRPVSPAAAPKAQIISEPAAPALPRGVRSIERAPTYRPPRADLSVLDPVLRRIREKFSPVAMDNLVNFPEKQFWYDTSPLYEVAPEHQVDQFLKFNGPTSSGETVKRNIKLASLFHHLRESGQLPEELLRSGDVMLPPGYRSRRQSAHNAGLLRILTEGSLDPYAQPKTYRYTNLLMGKEGSVALDSQNGQIVGLEGFMQDPKTGLWTKKGRGYPLPSYKETRRVQSSPVGSHYATIEDGFIREAEKSGMLPGQYSALGWPGQDARPYMAQVMDLVNEKAAKLGMDPKKLLERVMRGKDFLAIGGLLAGLGAEGSD